MSNESELEKLCKKNPFEMTILEFVVSDADCREGTGIAEAAAEELAALEHLAAVARDVNEWLKAIDMGGTGHQRSLEAALSELEKK